MEALAQPPISFVRGFAHQGFYLYCHQAPRNRAARAAAWVRLPRPGMNGNSRKSLRRLGARRMAARWVQGHSRRCLAFGLSMMMSRDCEDCRGGRRMCNPRKKPQGRQTQRRLSFGNACAAVSRTAYCAQCDKSSHCTQRLVLLCELEARCDVLAGQFPTRRHGQGIYLVNARNECSRLPTTSTSFAARGRCRRRTCTTRCGTRGACILRCIIRATPETGHGYGQQEPTFHDGSFHA